MIEKATLAGGDLVAAAKAAAEAYLDAMAEICAALIPPDSTDKRRDATIGAAAFSMLLGVQSKRGGVEAAGMHVGQGIGQAAAQMPGFAPVVFMGAIQHGIELGEAQMTASSAPANDTRQ